MSRQAACHDVENGGPVAYTLEVCLDPSGEFQDVRLDGESLWPIWFKVEWKGNGHLSAKIAGQRLSTREGDEIRFLVGSNLAARPAGDRT